MSIQNLLDSEILAGHPQYTLVYDPSRVLDMFLILKHQGVYMGGDPDYSLVGMETLEHSRWDSLKRAIQELGDLSKGPIALARSAQTIRREP